MAATTKSLLFNKIGGDAGWVGSKVTIVGTGAVGLACAYSLINQGGASELVLIDVSGALAPRGGNPRRGGGAATAANRDVGDWRPVMYLQIGVA